MYICIVGRYMEDNNFFKIHGGSNYNEKKKMELQMDPTSKFAWI